MLLGAAVARLDGLSCIWAAHASAWEALEKTTISPSPRFLTSLPAVRSSAPRSSPKCSWRSSSAAAAPSRSAIAVDPTRSVIRTDTVSMAVELTRPSSAVRQPSATTSRCAADERPHRPSVHPGAPRRPSATRLLVERCERLATSGLRLRMDEERSSRSPVASRSLADRCGSAHVGGRPPADFGARMGRVGVRAPRSSAGSEGATP